MTVRDVIQNIRQVYFIENSPEYIYQSALIIAGWTTNPDPIPIVRPVNEAGKLHIVGLDQVDTGLIPGFPIDQPERFIWTRLSGDGSSWIVFTHSHDLFAYCNNLVNSLMDEDVDEYGTGKTTVPAFSRHRVAYDYFLTQEGRICRGFDREEYVRKLAANGFTHIEVNGLAYPMGLETGPKGETYPMFYTYCPALDQFVYSELNKGLYPYYYLEANLNYLRENAMLARKYGLIPGMLCFEPRSVPEQFFEKYPMLRGARVDHPFRSFKPRYNMTITHPRVLEHYSEMVLKIMEQVPDLGFLNIWTNDSGAGFEHTKSLYVGRNGGAYLIREWKNDEEIARLAGENALRFFNTLKDAGRKINPDFKVITRLESFYGEHDVVVGGLKDMLEVETSSLVQKGWDMPYSHPSYPDQKDINGGSLYQRGFEKDEEARLAELKAKGSDASFYFGYGTNVMFAPLLGIPYPRLTYERLSQLRNGGVESLSHMGGSVSGSHAPFNINHEVLSAFQFNPDLDIDDFLKGYIIRNAGEQDYEKLFKAWKLAEEAILGYPNVSALYSTIGFSWYRLWARPLVPDIEAIDQADRVYYEDFMCTTPHNPNNVDLSRDVLFRLIPADKAGILVDRIDENVWEPLDEAISLLEDCEEGIIFDQKIRLQALRCWMKTQRNVAAWVGAVYGYMESKDAADKKKHQDKLKNTIRQEIDNTEDLLNLLDSSVEFMALTDMGETPLVYGDNLGELLLKRIVLMTKHIDDEPYIDHGYIERKAGEAII